MRVIEKRAPVVREIAIPSPLERERQRADVLRSRIGKLERVRRRLNEEIVALRLERTREREARERAEATIAELAERIASLEASIADNEPLAIPPAAALYEVAELKRRLAASGSPSAFDAFSSAYPQPELRGIALPLVSARDFARSRGRSYREIDLSGVPFTSQPAKVVGENNSRAFSGTSRAFFVAALDEACVMGRSNMVRTAGAILADFQDDERERASDRLELDAAIFSVEGDAAHVIEPVDDPSLSLSEAFVSLLAPQSDAFGHWITHQIPRLIGALDANLIPDVPVLVDAGLGQSHLDALALALGRRAMPIIEVGRGETVAVERAWYASTPFYIPFLPTNGTWECMATPADRWRRILESMEASARSVAGPGRGERVFLARRATLHRRITNVEEIESIARRHGFELVYPEDLTFAEQLGLVRAARFVIGPEGSAMFLNFYAQSGLKLAILSHPFTDLLTNYTVALEAREIDVTIFTGPVMQANDEPGFPNFGYRHFADYHIEPEAFDAFLGAWSPS